MNQRKLPVLAFSGVPQMLLLVKMFSHQIITAPYERDEVSFLAIFEILLVVFLTHSTLTYSQVGKRQMIHPYWQNLTV